MRSLQITGPGEFRLMEIDPPARGADEVLIRIRACTICNQHDLAVFAGRAHGGAKEYPLTPGFPGHEAAGEVVQVGPDVTDVMPFADYPAALERIRGGEAIKIALTWE